MAFYRKYRPQIIEEIDNAQVRERLLEFLRKNKQDLPHAFLFSGPKGTGKTTAARVVAKLFNCTKPSKIHGPCGECEQCISIAEGRNIDVLEMDAASNRGIEEIRELRGRINLAPAASGFKVYVIDEVHMLTTEAFNALLKTLEEPPMHAVFILATTDPQKVPPTIKSRCVHLNFSRAATPELLHALSRVVKSEKINITEEALLLIAQAADGSFRDAVKMLEQISFHKGKITLEAARTTLALSEEKSLERFLNALAKREAQRGLTEIANLVKNGMDLRVFLTDCLYKLEEMLVAEISGKKEDLWTIPSLKDAIRKLSLAFGEMKLSPIPQLPLELAVVEYCGEKVISDKQKEISDERKNASKASHVSPGLLTLEKLNEHWKDFIEEMKPFNHSVAGVLRSSRPKGVADGIVTIEAFYKFHEERLLEGKTRDTLARVLQKLFGEKVKVEIVLGKK